MDITPSSLTADERAQLLTLLKNSIGQDQYNQLRRQVGEERLLAHILETVPGIQVEIYNYRYATRKTDEHNRKLSMIQGALIGLILGLLLVAGAWLMQRIWQAPYWYSLAPAVNGAFPWLITGGMVSWLTNKNKRRYAFRQLLNGYFFLSLIGGLIGVYRWDANSQWSVKNFFILIWDKFQYVELCITGIVLFIMFIAWLLENSQMGKSDFQSKIDINPLGFEGAELVTYWSFVMVFGLSLPITMYAVVADAFHFTPWVAGNVQVVAQPVNQYPWLIIPIVASVAGALLGIILPARYQQVGK
jgi:hypothetical protein